MAHFAQLDENNKVIQVIVIDNDITHDEDGLEVEELGIAYCKSLFGENTKWIQTSYNGNMRGIFAGVGMSYDYTENKFIPDTTYVEITKESTDV